MSLSSTLRGSNRLTSLANAIKEKIVLPQRLKGGRIERIINYGKFVLKDYRQAFEDTVTDAKNNRKKATFYLSLIGLTTYLYKTNPPPNSFKSELVNYQNLMSTIGEPIRNPVCYNYLDELNCLDSQRRLHKLNFLIFTVFLREDFDPKIKIYEATCKYLQPSYLDYLSNRIVDIGIANRWILLERRLKDFDINPNEFNDQ